MFLSSMNTVNEVQFDIADTQVVKSTHSSSSISLHPELYSDIIGRVVAF